MYLGALETAREQEHKKARRNTGALKKSNAFDVKTPQSFAS